MAAGRASHRSRGFDLLPAAARLGSIGRMRLIALAPALILLAACGETGMSGSSTTADASNDLCFASIWGPRLTGHPASDAEFEMRPLAQEGKARIIYPGQATTRDFHAGRITVEIGRDDRVSRVYCG